MTYLLLIIDSLGCHSLGEEGQPTWTLDLSLAGVGTTANQQREGGGNLGFAD